MDELKFSKHHLWLRLDGTRAQIGISDHGQDELGEILSVELPDVGDHVDKNESFGELESVNTVSELISPISGHVVSVNTDLYDRPTSVNDDPYHEGWLIEVELNDEEQVEELLDPDKYEDFVAGEDET